MIEHVAVNVRGNNTCGWYRRTHKPLSCEPMGNKFQNVGINEVGTREKYFPGYTPG
jgi:hypothetical protein